MEKEEFTQLFNFFREIDKEKFIGRQTYLKTVLFGFMANGYISLRELEDQCKVNLRFMYLMDHQTPR